MIACKYVITVVVVVLVVVFSAWRGSSVPAGASGAAAAQAFYSSDDGATFFAAPADLIPPVESKGKTAVRAAVFSSDGGKTKFVGYLERYSPAAKAQLEKSRDALKRGDKNAGPAGPAAGDVEIKKPGAASQWISRRGPAAADVLNVKGPAGGTPEPVAP
jgi:hypothetical protein